MSKYRKQILLIPLVHYRYRNTTNNPILQAYILKTDIHHIAGHLLVHLPRGHINIGPALCLVYHI